MRLRGIPVSTAIAEGGMCGAAVRSGWAELSVSAAIAARR